MKKERDLKEWANRISLCKQEKIPNLVHLELNGLTTDFLIEKIQLCLYINQ